MKKHLTKIGIVLVTLALGYGFGRYAQPAEIITKEVEVIKRDVKTVVRTVKQPDGTVIRERTTEDKTVTDTSKSTAVENRKLWKANALIGYSSISGRTEYGIMIQKDYIGPISLGVYATTEKNIGLTVGMSF